MFQLIVLEISIFCDPFVGAIKMTFSYGIAPQNISRSQVAIDAPEFM